MSKLLFGLSVALIGMFVVFVGLVILIGVIKLIKLASPGQQDKASAADADVPAAAPRAVPAPRAVSAAPAGVSPEVLAAITAAIAAVWQGDTGFVVRRVRRLHNAPAWNRAGREDQTYSRM